MGRIGRVDAVEDRLEVAGDHGEWRSQLVADVGEERAPLLLVGFESSGHRVEAAGELLDRREVRTGPAEPDAVVAFLNAPGRRQHLVEVASGAGQAPRQGRGDGHDRQHGDDHRHRPEARQERRGRRDDRGDDDQEEDAEDAAEPLAAVPRTLPIPPAHEACSPAHVAGERIAAIPGPGAPPLVPGLSPTLVGAPRPRSRAGPASVRVGPGALRPT